MQAAWLARLNPEQRSVVDAAGHVLAIACPGSGKTSTMAAKAANMIASGQTILALSFSKKSAHELGQRIGALTDPRQAQRWLCCTVQAAMYRMFRSPSKNGQGSALFKGRHGSIALPEIVLGARQLILADAAARELGLRLGHADSLRAIEQVKRGELPTQDEYRLLADAYDAKLRAANCIDLLDLERLTLHYLGNGQLAPYVVDHILFDEFQDTGQWQWDWLKWHARAGVTITAVGDDDQSIYGFRGALGLRAMQAFGESCHPTRIVLGTNYRSRHEIIAASDRLIRHVSERIDKPIRANKGEGGSVSWQQVADDAAQGEWVAQHAAEFLHAGQSVAVIARSNAELEAVEGALLADETPFVKSEGKGLFGLIEARVLLALLAYVLDGSPGERSTVLNWLGMPANDLAACVRAFGASESLGNAKDFARLGVSEAGTRLWREWCERVHLARQLADEGLWQLLVAGAVDWLSQNAGRSGRVELIQTAGRVFSRSKRPVPDLVRAILAAQEQTRSHPRAADRPLASVNLITAHASKGLEFDVVFVIGVEQGRFPSERDGADDGMRLMYVAMTRAREHLILCSTHLRRPSPALYQCGLLAPDAKTA